MSGNEGLHKGKGNDHNHHPELFDAEFEDSLIQRYREEIEPLHHQNNRKIRKEPKNGPQGRK
jgi:hypothetical protein